MLTVNYGQILSPNFQRGLAKLSQCPQFKSPKLAYNVAKILKKVDEEQKIAQDLYNKLITEYAEKDEAGKVKPHNGIPDTFLVRTENHAEWDAKLKELHAISFDIDRPALDLDEVMVAQLSPVEITALDSLLTFDEAPTKPQLVKP